MDVCKPQPIQVPPFATEGTFPAKVERVVLDIVVKPLLILEVDLEVKILKNDVKINWVVFLGLGRS